METTVKVQQETKKRLLRLDICEKGKTFDMIINDLISNYQHTYKDYKKNVSDWKKSMEEHGKRVENYNKEKVMWDRLLKWAKSKGFKG